MHQLDPESDTIMPDDDSLYPYVNNDIKYGLFEDIVVFEENASLFADDTMTPCDFNIIDQHPITENANDTNIPCALEQSAIHSQ